MELIFLHGPAAVGKLTVARELAQMTGFRLFHNHLIVDALTAVFDFGTEPFIVLREQVWIAVFREAAQRNISLIFTFTPERTVGPSFIRHTIDAVESADGRVRFVKLACPIDELERRIEALHGKHSASSAPSLSSGSSSRRERLPTRSFRTQDSPSTRVR